jgi:hypothetical protein
MLEMARMVGLFGSEVKGRVSSILE